MAKRPDTPCIGCGKLTWTSPKSAPAAQRLCRDCRRAGKAPPEPVPRPEEWVPPEFGLADRGRRLWRDMTAERRPAPAERELLVEACRLVDRLDQLDGFLVGHGEVWLRFHARNEDGSVVEVVVDKALAEARQYALALKGLMAELRAMRGKQDEPKREASVLDDLAKRREERRRAAGLPLA